jgi:hypothetical protein
MPLWTSGSTSIGSDIFVALDKYLAERDHLRAEMLKPTVEAAETNTPERRLDVRLLVADWMH